MTIPLPVPENSDPYIWPPEGSVYLSEVDERVCCDMGAVAYPHPCPWHPR